MLLIWGVFLGGSGTDYVKSSALSLDAIVQGGPYNSLTSELS